MASTVSSSPWGNKPTVSAVGSWALDSEQNEAESQQKDNGSADFPSLTAAATAKPKKKKGQTLSLAEFSTYSAPSKARFQPSFQTKGLIHEDLSSLPTGPRQRTAEELEGSKLGGGFRSYGGGSGKSRYSEGEDSSSRWGSASGGSSDDTRRDSGNQSRADEVDDWAAGKKPTVSNGFERQERGGGGGLSDSQSKADESDNWGSNKSFAPGEPLRYGGAGVGGGFERDRRGSGRADRGSESIGGGADSKTWGRKKDERTSSPVNGNGSGNGRPKLNLQPRTLPVVMNDVQQLQQVLGIIPKAKGSNPFGEARPREEVLVEKGQDWKAIDEQLKGYVKKDVSESCQGITKPATPKTY